MSKDRVSIVVPVFCNAGSLDRTYTEVKDQIKLSGCDYEFLFINDGSTDNSQEVLDALHGADKKVRVISFTRNFGQAAAMIAGMEQASGHCAVVISADLQEPATLIPQMIESWKSGAEIVVANREARQDPWASRLSSAIAYKLLTVALPQMPAGGFDFALLGRAALDLHNSIDNRNRFFQGDLLWMGYPITVIPYTRRRRLHGKSGYTFWKKFKNFLDAMLASSYLPIRFISLLGVVLSFSGLIYGISVIFNWFLGKSPFTGWAPLMIINLVIGGFILLMLGVLGEYIWRIHDELRKRPNFVIKTDTKNSDD